MKKKLWIFIICVLIILLLSLLYFLKEKSKNDNSKKNYGTLVEVSYSCSGNMLGNHYGITLDIENNILSVENAEIHSDPILQKTYNATDKNTIEDITNLINDLDLPKLSNSEIDENLFVYDACTPTFGFVYKTGKNSYDKKYYSVSMYYKMTQIEYDAFYEIKKDLESLEIENNLISELYKETD